MTIFVYQNKYCSMAATRKKFNSLEECEAFVDNLSYANMRNWLISFLMEDSAEKVILTKSQFEAFFRIREESGIGKKGRPRKSE